MQRGCEVGLEAPCALQTHSATSWRDSLEQVAFPLWASVFPPVKWRCCYFCPLEVLGEGWGSEHHLAHSPQARAAVSSFPPARWESEGKPGQGRSPSAWRPLVHHADAGDCGRWWEGLSWAQEGAGPGFLQFPADVEGRCPRRLWGLANCGDRHSPQHWRGCRQTLLTALGHRGCRSLT